jgi:phosphoribosylformylglycinamidine synthase
VIGIVGILEDVTKAVPADFQRAGDAVLLLTLPSGSAGTELVREFGSSEYAKTVLGELWGAPPRLDLVDEHELHRCLAALADVGVLHSASDISDGGLAVALSEASIANKIGASVRLVQYSAESPYPHASRLFAEETCQAIVTCLPDQVERIKEIADDHGFVTVIAIGYTGGTQVTIQVGDQMLVNASIEELTSAWSSSLESTLHDNTANEVFA